MTVYRCLEKYSGKTSKGLDVVIYIVEGLNRKRCKLFANNDINLQQGQEYILQINNKQIISYTESQYISHPTSYQD